MAPRAAVFSAFLLLGCFPPGEGIDPPNGKVYFPVGLAVDEQKKFLYIVNSDFDLQFNAGTVQSWDLERLRALVPHYCQSDADCDADRVCDLLVPTDELEQDDPTHFIQNGGAPSHWCVEPGPEGSPCGVLGQQSNRDQSLYPGRCNFISQFIEYDGEAAILPTNEFDQRTVKIGAFATDVVRKSLVLPAGWTVLNETPEQTASTPHERLFIPVRGDATLHWIDIDQGKLKCGQGGNDGTCNDQHRSGDRSEEENTRENGRLAPEPFGVDADENALTVMVTNQTSGAVALFSTRRTSVDGEGNSGSFIDWDSGPRYVFAEGGMPARPIGVANVPIPLALPSSGRERLPGYLVSFRNAATMFLLRVYDDAVADPLRPYTKRYESERILTNSSGVDSRGIAVDAFHRKANERDCLERFGVTESCARSPSEPKCAAILDPSPDNPTFVAFEECLELAAATPLDVFVTNRAPSSLIIGRSQPLVSDSVVNDLPTFDSPLPLDVGPSRVIVGEIINAQGERERRVFVVCFDSRRVAVYDPERQRVETEIVTGRGPQAFAIDIGDDYAYAYVGHFLDSYVGVVDLDQRHRGQYGAMIATIGDPTPPRASK